jgi:diguanylate cyclase (GGDEF)-like protein
MSALKIRLSLTAGELSSLQATPSENAAARIRANVIECVDVLGKLHQELSQETSTNLQLKNEIQEIKAALKRAKEDLVGMQACERRAQHRASHDSLTLLGNRMFFGSHLEKTLSAAATSENAVAVFYLDLDGFKLVNDTHGHAVGDQLLCIVAARLNQALRADDVVCRLGGDEFACVLGGPASRVHLDQLAGKLFDSVACACKIDGLKITVRPSIGIALWPRDGETPEALLKSADAAMYHAKRTQTGYAFAESVKSANLVDVAQENSCVSQKKVSCLAAHQWI